MLALVVFITGIGMGIKDWNDSKPARLANEKRVSNTSQSESETEKIKFAPTYTCYTDPTDSKGYVSSVLYHVKSASNSLLVLECNVPINSGDGTFRATIGLDPVKKYGTLREERPLRFRIKLTFGDDPRDVISSSLTTATVTSMTYNSQGGFDITFVYDEDKATVHTARFIPNWPR